MDAHKILLILIPAHIISYRDSSHITQPLDLSTNGEFKQKLRERFKPIFGEDGSMRRNRLLQISARALSRVNNKDTILLGWSKSGLYPFDPEVAYRSTAIVETIDEFPSHKLGKKRKRGPKINGGEIIYNGKRAVSSPPPVLHPPTFEDDEQI